MAKPGAAEKDRIKGEGDITLHSATSKYSWGHNGENEIKIAGNTISIDKLGRLTQLDEQGNTHGYVNFWEFDNAFVKSQPPKARLALFIWYIRIAIRHNDRALFMYALCRLVRDAMGWKFGYVVDEMAECLTMQNGGKKVHAVYREMTYPSKKERGEMNLKEVDVYKDLGV